MKKKYYINTIWEINRKDIEYNFDSTIYLRSIVVIGPVVGMGVVVVASGVVVVVGWGVEVVVSGPENKINNVIPKFIVKTEKWSKCLMRHQKTKWFHIHFQIYVICVYEQN